MRQLPAVRASRRAAPTVINLLMSLVPHTAGVELHLSYIYHNMRLTAPSALMESVSLESFALGLLDEYEAEQLASELPSLHSLPRTYRPHGLVKQRQACQQQQRQRGGRQPRRRRRG